MGNINKFKVFHDAKKALALSFAFLIIAWANNGLVRYIPGFNAYILIAFFIFWIAFEGTSKRHFLLYLSNESKWLILLITITFISSLLYYQRIEERLIDLVYLFMLFSLFLFYFKYPNKKFMVLVILFLLIDKLAITINTLLLLQNHQDISRLLASGYDAVEGIVTGKPLLGGYNFIYATVALMIFLKIEAKNISRKYFILVIPYLAISFILVAKAGYTTALIFTVIFWFLSSFVTEKRSLWIGVTIALLMLGFYFIPDMVSFLLRSDLLPDVVLSRLVMIDDLIAGRSIKDTTLAMRFFLYSKSWSVFVGSPQNFLFGVYERAANYERSGLWNIVGMHSEWLDSLALLGLFRFILLGLFLYKAANRLMKNSHNKTALLYVFVYIVLVGFINPIMSLELYLNVLIIMPFSYFLLKPGTKTRYYMNEITLIPKRNTIAKFEGNPR